MGLGPVHTVGLAEARKRAQAARLQLPDGIDPVDARKAKRAECRLETAKKLTFEEAAREYHKQNETKWKNLKVVAQWLEVMEDYVFPILGKLPVAAVDTGLVLKVLERPHTPTTVKDYAAG